LARNLSRHCRSLFAIAPSLKFDVRPHCIWPQLPAGGGTGRAHPAGSKVRLKNVLWTVSPSGNNITRGALQTTGIDEKGETGLQNRSNAKRPLGALQPACGGAASRLHRPCKAAAGRGTCRGDVRTVCRCAPAANRLPENAGRLCPPVRHEKRVHCNLPLH
jgi:hypothetical protein